MQMGRLWSPGSLELWNSETRDLEARYLLVICKFLQVDCTLRRLQVRFAVVCAPISIFLFYTSFFQDPNTINLWPKPHLLARLLLL